uniref:RxLR effector candidate protein n=1 Tax=Hyaloperonospora arabidopsidis (strain Emoy2) TaxID=559515 RepID=M4BGS7_HYAAE
MGMHAEHRISTSQFPPSSNNGQATKTSKEPGDRPPYPGWEVPYRGAQISGGGLLAAACATGGSAACKPKGEQQPRHPEVRGTATAVVTPSPSTY